MMMDVKHPNIPNLKVPAFPVKFSETQTTARFHPPLLGEHNNQVLQELGYSEKDIKQLKNQNII
jgi:crotonobetainyl-CoA:carnitine CoA-transferase CaiB-like acyl-CoA transferase